MSYKGQNYLSGPKS
uniref:Uncharacterized protein n=1 Tax=Anguilla anguilla TaxID=7936 RepID=A0A0E9TJG9_ANGAN